jgi:predicted SAM-dependent methyltransferase
MTKAAPLTGTARTHSTIRRFDLVAAILVSLTVGFSAGKVWVRDVHIAPTWQRYRAAVPIKDYVHSHSVRKLQIGAGGNSLPGWLNTDIEPKPGQAYLDATKPFPLPDRSFRNIFTEHLIEHLTYEDGLAMLRECHRILEPGGTLRIETPNLMRFIGLFNPNKTKELRQYEAGKFEFHGWSLVPDPECLILNHQMRDWGHQFLYDPATLHRSLERAGFRIVKDRAPGATDDVELKSAGLRHNSNVQAMNDYETMAVEAIRQ